MQTIWPFFGASLAVLMAVTYIPALSLWLPSLSAKASHEHEKAGCDAAAFLLLQVPKGHQTLLILNVTVRLSP